MFRETHLWGDAERVIVDPSASLANALLNTVSGSIKVGRNTFAGHNVSLITGTHRIDQLNEDRKNSFPHSEHDIIIGDGVWLGSNAVVLGPCTIHDHAVIAAGAVVLPGTEIPVGAVVGGVPARILKMIDLPPTLRS
jgi:acetyltransferase-like isoleucine patch superfamily enzyme